jgi:four helix bundle protein
MALASSVRLRASVAQINSFRDLEVWLLAMDLVDDIIKASRAIPRVEFDLRRQMTRAAISIPSNIAEGWKRKGRRAAYQNYVSIAMGSHGELETQLEVCFRNGFLKREEWKNMELVLMRVRLMLDRLHDALD